MQIKAVIFDWDGTLVDSVQRISDCLLFAALECGLVERTPEQYAEIIGLGMYEAINQLYPGLDEEQTERYRDAYARRFVSQESTPSCFFDGVPEVLERLRARGFALAVATGKSRRGLDRSLRALGAVTWFDATRCADETASKPDPLMLHELCEELGCSPAQAVMVGDTEYDLEMASRAGMHRVGVDFGVHEVERLQMHQPVAVISHVSELEAALAQITGAG